MIGPARDTPISAEEAGIRFEDVRKIYRMGDSEVRALDGVSVSFEQGEFWAVMGPSGSGKSTMLNLLGCLDRPTSGRCCIGGHDVAHLDDDELSEVRLRRLGFVFQSFNLISQLTVSENIQLPLYYLGWDAADSTERARELAEMVEKGARAGVGSHGQLQGIGYHWELWAMDRLEHRPTELSGGQQQRVAIARALANDPPILLADEPTGNLDTSTGNQIMELLCELNRSGRTIVMVTHEPDIAKRAQLQLHMRDGRVERIDGGRP